MRWTAAHQAILAGGSISFVVVAGVPQPLIWSGIVRRVISVWLPRWPVDRLRREHRIRRKSSTSPSVRPDDTQPFALATAGRDGLVLSAVNQQAEIEGLKSGMRLADAHALFPALRVHQADEEADRQSLLRLALWCGRFTPWTAPNGTDGLVLDITGCAHLFGGEEALMAELVGALVGLGFEARLGLADTAAAAWACARFADDPVTILPVDGTATALAPFPVEGLDLNKDAAMVLRRMGLSTIGALYDIPRTSLGRRFRTTKEGETVLERLDRALGRISEPLSPLMPQPQYLRRMAFSEPLMLRDGLEAALRHLAAELTQALDRDHKGARRYTLWCYRVDGGIEQRPISLARSSHDPEHLLRLFAERLDDIDAGFGIDVVTLHASRIETTINDQLSLTRGGRARDGVDRLVDRLINRLGTAAVIRPQPVESHLPERACRRVPPDIAEDTAWSDHMPPERQARPFRLFMRPEAIEVMAEVPDGPPLIFTWRRVTRRVAHAAGPERIAPEWWTTPVEPDEALRDYYQVEDTAGRRYWLFRAGLYQDSATKSPPSWYVHGLDG
ncbi:MAG: hypothetical protein CMM46_03710 [Rhodospirillaceae bacterium]|nr:hypothetical protein [Rhodospirillaceae bacterium]